MRTLLRFTCGFILAALAAILLLTGTALYLTGAAMLVLSIVLFTLGPRLAPGVLGFALGLFWTAGYQLIFAAPAQTLAGQVMTVQCEATDYGTETDYGQRLPVVLQAGQVQTRAMVWLNWEKPLIPGDRFTVLAALENADPDGSDYYYAQGIRLFAYGKAQFHLTGEAAPRLRYLPRRIAHGLEQALERSVPADALGYAMALTTGNRALLTNGEKAALQTSGIYHALALSGLHMTVLIGSLGLVISKKRLRAWVGIPLSIAFAVITGASASIVRAAVMQCLVLLAPLLGREEDPPTSLAAAGLLLTLQNPYCLLGWGLQLSFAAMAGLIFLGNRFYRAMAGERKDHRLYRLRSWLSASLSATVAATVSTTPLMMAHFGQLSLIAPVTNLLTGWAIVWCFRGSLLTGLLGKVFPSLGLALGWLTAWPIRYVQRIAAALSRLPFATLCTGSAYAVGWVLLVYLLMILVLLRPKGQKMRVLPICSMIGSLGVCLLLMLFSGGGASLTVLDVGQGQCLLALEKGQAAVIDCGGSQGSPAGTAAAELAAQGIYRVEYLILTHYDEDHSGGVEELLERMPVSNLLLPDIPGSRRQAIEEAAQARNIPIRYITAPTRASLGGGSLELLPPPDQNENTGLGVLVKFSGLTALITGDMDVQQEQHLMDTAALPDVDLLIAGHHGSKYSTSEALLRQTAPELVAISVGKNSYGHPAQETLQRIAAWGARCCRTDQQGTIRLKGA